MGARNQHQLALLLLLLGSLLLALLAGYGIAALATQSGESAAARTPTPLRPTAVLGATDEQPAADATPEPTSAPVGITLLDDSFDSAASGWLVQDTPTWSTSYVDGQYHMALHGQRTIGVSAPLDAASYRLTADVAIGSGAGGIIFLAAEPDAFYRLMINADGLYALEVQRQAESPATTIVDWTASEALRRPAGSTYRVRIERQGRMVRFWVDDQPLLSWAGPTSGTRSQYGFAVSSVDQRAEVSFDNLHAEELPEPSGT